MVTIPRNRILLATILMSLVLIVPEALAAGRPIAPGSANGLIKSASMVGPMGLNPFLALAAFGFAAKFGLFQLPEGLQIFSHPLLWVGLGGLGLMLQFGRSTKLTKPIAELLGTGESLFAVVAVIMMMLPHFGATEAVHTAGLGTGALMLFAGMSAVGALIILRTALDIFIWLSPIPFVDGVFQVIKAVVTLGLVLLAVTFPVAAIVVNVAILIATGFMVRWAIRTARFGATLVYDLSVGRFSPVELPKDAVTSTDLGPFTAFVLDVPGLKRRTHVDLELEAGRWFIVTKGEKKNIPLGDDHDGRFTKGWLGTELALPQGKVLLAPRYRHLTDTLVKHTEGTLEEKPSRLGATRRPMQAVAH